MPTFPPILGVAPHARMLFLNQSAHSIARQLAGDSAGAAALPLRDDVSTDEITPVDILSYYDQRIARYAHTGFYVEGVNPIAAGALAAGGFQVLVAGKRYGKGSSREHSPFAERCAGIQLVVAESFERIYRQNADNIGLFTSTDFGLIARIQRGEAISVEELVQGRDGLAAHILRAGGLLRFGQTQLAGVAPASVPGEQGPMTLTEKIVHRHRLNTAGTPSQPQHGDGLFLRADWRFIHEYYTGMAAHMLDQTFGDDLALHQPEAIVVFEDHTNYVHESPSHLQKGLVPNIVAMCRAQREFACRFGLRQFRALNDEEAALDTNANVAGISHAMVLEHFALPGQVVVGTDSHTPHSGAIGCLAFGVGTTDMASAFVTGAVRLSLPESVKVQLNGRLADGMTAKDVVLHLLALPYFKTGGALGKVLEFCGPVVQAFSIDERATLTNMCAELGALSGIVAPDHKALAFLQTRRGLQFALDDWMHSDTDARYARTIALDCSALSVMVALPGDPGNGMPLQGIAERPAIDIAYGGSCTGGKLEDFEHYHAVLSWAAERGLRVADGVELILQFGTTAVRDACTARGYLQVFEQVGARILQPSCGACGNCGPGASLRAEQVTVSAINRNFPGRGGPGKVWLASPPTVAASAIAGRLMSFEELIRACSEQA